MDVHGGKDICLGPTNYLAGGWQAIRSSITVAGENFLGGAWQQIPTSITVEGANILTRSMIIFGQGAIRGHPYVLAEIAATTQPDAAKASRDFDAALWGHVSFVVSNAARSFWLSLTGARFLPVPGAPETRRYFQNLERLTASFALASDMAMMFLGGDLKRRECISARLGDVLSQLYLASCTIKRWHDEGCQSADLPLMDWAVQDALVKAQEAF